MRSEEDKSYFIHEGKEKKKMRRCLEGFFFRNIKSLIYIKKNIVWIF